MQEQPYNGYTNRETWLASLWLNNTPESQAILLEAQAQSDDTQAKATWLEDELHSYLDVQLDDMSDGCDGPSLWTDLLLTAFNKVNWVEVIGTD
jgi:hypothetical protein